MPKIKIVPSILSAKMDKLQEEIEEIEDYSCCRLMLWTMFLSQI